MDVEAFLEKEFEEAIVAFPGGPAERAVDGCPLLPVDAPGEGGGLVEGVGEDGGEATIDAEEGVEVMEGQRGGGDDEELVGEVEEGHGEIDADMLLSPEQGNVITTAWGAQLAVQLVTLLVLAAIPMGFSHSV